jgi:hypothetical protein
MLAETFQDAIQSMLGGGNEFGRERDSAALRGRLSNQVHRANAVLSATPRIGVAARLARMIVQAGTFSDCQDYRHR